MVPPLQYPLPRKELPDMRNCALFELKNWSLFFFITVMIQTRRGQVPRLWNEAIRESLRRVLEGDPPQVGSFFFQFLLLSSPLLFSSFFCFLYSCSSFPFLPVPFVFSSSFYHGQNHSGAGQASPCPRLLRHCLVRTFLIPH